MAKRTQYDIESEKLRQMGLDPEKMTIRERFEALGGVPEGTPLTELLKSVPGTKKSDPTQKKLPSESDSATFSGVDPTRNPFSAIKPASVAPRGANGHTNTGSSAKVGVGTKANGKRGEKASNTRSDVSGTMVFIMDGAQMALFQ